MHIFDEITLPFHNWYYYYYNFKLTLGVRGMLFISYSLFILQLVLSQNEIVLLRSGENSKARVNLCLQVSQVFNAIKLKLSPAFTTSFSLPFVFILSNSFILFSNKKNYFLVILSLVIPLNFLLTEFLL